MMKSALFVLWALFAFAPALAQKAGFQTDSAIDRRAQFNLPPAVLFQPSAESYLEKKLVAQAGLSVWSITNQTLGGSAFFISPNHFITNFHVAEILLKSGPLGEIVLWRGDGARAPLVKKLKALSAVYDLALFETEGHVSDYLEPEAASIRPEENLYALAYPQSKFKKINRAGSVYFSHNSFFYSVFFDHSDLRGSSGSPIVNGRGELMGVAFMAIVNFAHVIHTRFLKEFIGGGAGLLCLETAARDCLKAEEQNIKARAARGDVFAQYKLGFNYLKGRSAPKDMGQAVYWMKKSAARDFSLAQYELAMMLLEEGSSLNFKAAYDLMSYLAEPRDYPPAQYQLARMYFEGKGTYKSYEKAFYWMRRSALLGYAPAQMDLSEMYFTGEATDTNYEEAFYWISAADERGFLPAAVGLPLLKAMIEIEKQAK